MSYIIYYNQFIKGENCNFYDYTEEKFDIQLEYDGVWEENFIAQVDIDIESISISCNEEIDLTFFERKMKNIKEISIRCKSIRNANSLSKLNSLTNLSIITYKNSDTTFDFPDSLKSLTVICHKNFIIKKIPTKLEFLSLENFKYFNEIENFNELNNLKKIELTNCHFVDMNKILNLKNLIYIAMYKCQLIFKSDNFQNFCVKYINFEKIRFENVNWITNLQEIDILILDDCGEIESLKHLENKKTLRGLSINGKTKIIDGDFNFLETLLNLKNCSITSHKNYTHKSILFWNWDNFDKDKIECFVKK